MPDKSEPSPCCGGDAPATAPRTDPCCCGQRTNTFEFPLYKPVAESGSASPEQTVSICRQREYWIKGFTDTAAGTIPLVDTSLVFRDTLGGWKARWGINRMNYKVTPGLYGVGNPNDTSPVLVTANYKMSFDRLRKELSGIDAWIMVIETFGINVWCAAGKGTFGTEEIVRRIGAVRLSSVVSHRTIIVPQLGAPGVAAHTVRNLSGFRVVYGPVRARDIRKFLDAGMKADRKMRTVEFDFADRLILTPIEVINTWKPVAVIGAAILIAHMTGLIAVSFPGLYPFIGAVLMGTVVGPVLLPWIPGRAFSVKGWFLGLLWAAVVISLRGTPFQSGEIFTTATLLLLLPPISAFLTMNFTGASTYTSLSGVRNEMKFAMPAIVVSASAGMALWVAGHFI